MIGSAPGTATKVVSPNPRSAMGPSKVAPLASSSARVASRSSHISESSWCRGEECSRPSHTVVVGCTPTSLGPLLKMSQPPPEAGSSTLGHPSTSRRKARVAGGSSEEMRACSAVITDANLTSSGEDLHRVEVVLHDRLHPGSAAEPHEQGADHEQPG